LAKNLAKAFEALIVTFRTVFKHKRAWPKEFVGGTISCTTHFCRKVRATQSYCDYVIGHHLMNGSEFSVFYIFENDNPIKKAKIIQSYPLNFSYYSVFVDVAISRQYSLRTVRVIQICDINSTYCSAFGRVANARQVL
jgi:hypothetical protein